MNESARTIIRYLLGELSDSEQTALEDKYFTDPQVFDKMVKTENELVDNYARGRLNPQLRERFEQYYLADPQRRERAKFAQVLVAKLDQELSPRASDHSGVQALPWWRLLLTEIFGKSPAFAFSALILLLLMFGAGWLFLQGKRLRQELIQTQSARATQEKRERELQEEIANQRTRMENLNAELYRARSQGRSQAESPVTRAVPAFVTLLLTTGGTRGLDAGAAPKLTIPAGTRRVRLQLSQREHEYPSYRAVVAPIGGQTIFTRQGLKPKTTKSGTVFVLVVPAGKFLTGDYVLSLQGVRPDGEVDDVSKSLFRVERK